MGELIISINHGLIWVLKGFRSGKELPTWFYLQKNLFERHLFLVFNWCWFTNHIMGNNQLSHEYLEDSAPGSSGPLASLFPSPGPESKLMSAEKSPKRSWVFWLFLSTLKVDWDFLRFWEDSSSAEGVGRFWKRQDLWFVNK